MFCLLGNAFGLIIKMSLLLTYYGKKKGKLEKVVLISGIIVDKKDMDYPIFPIGQIRWQKAAQSCYGLSLMDSVISLQKAVTSIESAMTIFSKKVEKVLATYS